MTSDLILATGDGVAGSTYTWTDSDIQAGLTYSYWLQEVEVGGKTTEYGPATGTLVADVSVPYRLALPFVQP